MSFHPLNDLPFKRALKRARPYPGLTAEMLAYEIQVICDFVKAKRGCAPAVK